MRFLIWTDAKSFRTHLEAMRFFRQSHAGMSSGRGLLKDSTNVHNACLARSEKLILHLAGPRGKAIIVPVWKIEAPPGSQN